MSVKVSPKYQVVIPAELRDGLAIKPGSEVEVISKGKVLYLVPVPKLEDIQKSLKGRGSSENVREKKDRI